MGEHFDPHGFARGAAYALLRDLAGDVGHLLEIQFRQDSIRDRLAAQLDSLESDFRRMVGVMEGLPELTDGVMAGFNERVAELIGTMNAGIDNAFSDLDRQRLL